MSTLATEKLSKSYRGIAVVSEVDVNVNSGEVVGLLGPNGAGKTTCFYMIVGMINSDGGAIWLDDKEISNMPMHERSRLGIGYLPQEPSVFRKLSVEDNIMAILQAQRNLSEKERHDRMETLLEEFGISHKRDAMGISLSGGERRRVEIARALALKPAFILLDEPFAGIDPKSVKEIQQMIAYLRDHVRIGILITDHNVRETLGICDRAYILRDGRVFKMGAPDELLADQAVREVYLGSDFRL
ncbi:MAG: LPS export ABC transporter ATP-binding protein [Gammaproteobacteria bacterium]|nr:LPS export ABC transporter ATP-binding protein [Gammaproteobacteria bacterium]MDH3464586.1 LPS export ABC transporter ATP-binding protein [Gammaproteobacteria bacterium]